MFFNKDIRYYFDVDNRYVLEKMGIILAPLLWRGEWGKHKNEHGDSHMGFLEPKLEVHAPDLYIPLMAFISYVLISCLNKGIGDQ